MIPPTPIAIFVDSSKLLDGVNSLDVSLQLLLGSPRTQGNQTKAHRSFILRIRSSGRG